MVNQVFARGAFLALIALYFLIQAPGYAIGSFNRPGAGFFALMVGSLLLLNALAIMVRSRLVEAPVLDFRFRNIGLVIAGLVSFVVVTEYVNMLAAVAVMVTIVSFASDTYSWRRNVVIVVALCLVAVAMKAGLGVTLPLY